MSKWILLVLLAACGAKSAPATEPRPADPVTSPSTPVASGAICGTRGAPACEAPMFCNFPPGAQCGMADAPGRCEQRPEMCAEIYKPVCGCDNKTYPNECSAAAAGVGVMSEGECVANVAP